MDEHLVLGICLDPGQPSPQQTRTIAVLAMAFSVAIELGQLYHAAWIDSIRHTTLGGFCLLEFKG